MKKITKIIYPIRIILFIIHLLMLFMILDDIIYVNIFGYIFLLIDIIYVIRTITELITQKSSYKKDIYYNIMQVGLYTYIGVLWYRLMYSNVVWSKEFIIYLKTNCVILSLLMIFLIFYSTTLIDKMKNL